MVCYPDSWERTSSYSLKCAFCGDNRFAHEKQKTTKQIEEIHAL